MVYGSGPAVSSRPRVIMIRPVAFVRTKASKEKIKSRKAVSLIEFNERLSSALDGVEDFSHIIILYWLDGVSRKERSLLKTHPRGRKDMPLLGIFATRVPMRPNPIGLTMVKLLGRRSNILRVEGLDAFDGTPVLDIKPYDPWDSIASVNVPDWWKMLEREREGKCRASHE